LPGAVRASDEKPHAPRTPLTFFVSGVSSWSEYVRVVRADISWHDSQRTEASQDFYLSHIIRNLHLWAGISHFRTALEILATFALSIC